MEAATTANASMSARVATVTATTAVTVALEARSAVVDVILGFLQERTRWLGS
jgi:hypothetical protein